MGDDFRDTDYYKEFLEKRNELFLIFVFANILIIGLELAVLIPIYTDVYFIMRNFTLSIPGYYGVILSGLIAGIGVSYALYDLDRIKEFKEKTMTKYGVPTYLQKSALNLRLHSEIIGLLIIILVVVYPAVFIFTSSSEVEFWSFDFFVVAICFSTMLTSTFFIAGMVYAILKNCAESNHFFLFISSRDLEDVASEHDD